MERYRKSKKDNIIIDLTSMLDVVFILLLVVLCSQKALQSEIQFESEKLHEERTQLQDEINDANNKKALYDQLIDIEENPERYYRTVSISVPYNPDKITERTITVFFEGDEKNYNINGSNTEEAFNSFKSYMIQSISANTDLPVILLFNSMNEQILYRDDIEMRQILEELQLQFDNLYIKHEATRG